MSQAQEILKMIEEEQWKPITGFEDYYEISSHGKIRSLPRVKIDTLGRKQRVKGRVLKLNIRSQNTKFVHLWVNGKDNCRQVHRLVAEHFIGYSDLPVNHKDRNRLNNHVSNLEYVTSRENTNHWIGCEKKNLRGVTRQGGRYRAKIYKNGKTIHLGYYDCPESAHKAYLNEVIKMEERKYAESAIIQAIEYERNKDNDHTRN